MLLAALWLLLLVGTIGAFLMARSLQAAAAVKSDEIALRESYALASAVDAVVADVMINGPRSRWYQLPGSGVVTIGDTDVAITITTENGRLDLNDASLELVDDVFRGLGYPAQARNRLLEVLELRRASSRPLISMPEAAAVLQGAIVDETAGPCLADLLTVFSALSYPRLGQAPEELRAALTRAGRIDGLSEPGSVAIGPIEPVRLVATVGQGRQLTVVLRITATGGMPYMVHHWSSRPMCDAMRPTTAQRRG